MDTKKSRMLGTVALTVPLMTLMMRGLLRDDGIPLWLVLGAAAFVAVLAHHLWPLFELFREQNEVPLVVAWKRVAGTAAVAIPLTVVITIGGKWLSYELDPWLVLAYLMLGAMYAYFGDWHDTTIRRQLRWRA